MPPAVRPPRHPLRSAILCAATLLAGWRGALGQDGAAAGAVLGRWTGTSTCVKAQWNAACNDEVVIYDFVPSDSAGRITLHAQKVIRGKPEPMGDLEFTYDPSTRQWSGNFDNARVSIRWIFEVSGSRLTGRVVDRRSLRIARNVAATR